ncbi:MAG: TrmH family RNA methyltransferase [Rhodospirillales bacterium]|nr:MAG: TrmH family RNA methyltransferase [Rhodospirillales bacterium]
MRGYFGIGMEGVSKAMNAGSLFRTAHAFGASFVFTVAAAYARAESGKADTSRTEAQVPFYAFPDPDSLVLPHGCALVGVELLDEATELPRFRHPRCAAYVLGPERGVLSPGLAARCRHLVRIPTRFSVNVGIAGAILMYDRLISLGRFPRRPEWPAGAAEPLPEPVFGDPKLRRRLEVYRTAPPEPRPRRDG